MSTHDTSGRPDAAAPDPSALGERPRTRWQTFRLVVKVVELRLRFVALLAITGLVFAYWDTLWNRYDKWMRPAASRSLAASTTEYYCPMHPNVIRDDPGSCPICGMPLSRRKKGERASLPRGVISRVQLSPMRIRQAGLETAEVSYAPLTETLSAVGSVEFDERRLRSIASRTRGMARVETLLVNFTGIDVVEGQTLAELYSPELSQAIQELLLAHRAEREPTRPQSARGRSLLGEPGALTRLSSEKLKLWGITQAQIDRILAEGRADWKVPISSPISGHVLKKSIVEGQYVSEGQEMFEVADLSTVWVKAQVFEDQVGLVRIGQTVEATVEAFPGRTFAGKVAFIQPHLDPATRTVEVRYDLENPGHRLRPGMFATVTLKTPVAETPMFRGKTASGRPAGIPIRRTNLTVEEQKVCPVTGAGLGTMDTPVPADVQGEKVWTCCEACPPKLKADPARYLARLTRPASGLAEQTNCPVTGLKLGSMGDPIAVEVGGRTVLTCCASCPPKLKADPARYLARLDPPPADGVLSVPESAVIDTGALRMVYVEAEPGVFDGRKVVLGPRCGDRFPVLEGLMPGEKVVAQGAFLVDAESRLNPATRGEAPDHPGETPPGPAARSSTAPAGHVH